MTLDFAHEVARYSAACSALSHWGDLAPAKSWSNLAHECSHHHLRAPLSSRKATNSTLAVSNLLQLHAAGATGTEVSSWLVAAVERYALTSRSQFWNFIEEVRLQTGGGWRWKIESWAPGSSGKGKTLLHRYIGREPYTVLINTGVDIDFWSSYDGLTDVSSNTTEAILSRLIETLKEREFPLSDLFEQLYRHLAGDLNTAAAKITSRRNGPSASQTSSPTRASILSFALLVGDPPPAGIASYLVSACSLGYRESTAGGDFYEAFCGRPYGAGVQYWLQSQAVKAHFKACAPAPAFAHRRSCHSRLAGISQDYPMVRAAGHVQHSARAKVVHHLSLGASNWCS